MAYDKLKKEELILRDELAIERTRLAEERTYLSYIRTGMSMILAASFSWAISPRARSIISATA